MVGICGPSCSGESIVAQGVAQEFGSLLYPIEADNWFKPVKPSCLAVRSCWEQPASVDLPLLARQLREAVAALAAAAHVP